MGTAPTGYNTPKTNWQAANVVTPTDMNRIESNIQAVEEGSRTIDPAQTPSSNVGSLRQLLDWFANRIKAITGKTNWYDTPSKTLEDLNAHINNTNNPHNTTYSQVGAAPASHTHTPSQISPQGAGSGLDADLVDGLHASQLIGNKAITLFVGKLTTSSTIQTFVGGSKFLWSSLYATGKQVYFEANISWDSTGVYSSGVAVLYDFTNDTNIVSVSSGNSSETRVRSAAITIPDGHEIGVYFHSDYSNYYASLYSAKIIIA